MRTINKIDGDKHSKKIEKESLISVDKDSLTSSLTYTPKFFGTVTPAEAPVSKDSISFKDAYGFCFKNFFQPNQNKTTANSLTVFYAVTHSIHHEGISNQLKRHIPGHHSFIDLSEFPVYSYLQLKFTNFDSRIYLHLECSAFSDLFDYDLKKFLQLLAEFDKRDKHSDHLDSSPVGIKEQEFLPNGMHSEVRVRQLTTDHGVFVKPLLNTIQSYMMNCLNRFKEISINREIDAYNTALSLGDILARIEANYLTVTFADYRKAADLLETLERNDTYQMDPQIWLSMTSIRLAIELLGAKALTGDKGIELNAEQLDILMQELKLHEGTKPKSDIWFPLGTVDKLSQQLEDFYPGYNNSATSFVI